MWNQCSPNPNITKAQSCFSPPFSPHSESKAFSSFFFNIQHPGHPEFPFLHIESSPYSITARFFQYLLHHSTSSFYSHIYHYSIIYFQCSKHSSQSLIIAAVDEFLPIWISLQKQFIQIYFRPYSTISTSLIVQLASAGLCSDSGLAWRLLKLFWWCQTFLGLVLKNKFSFHCHFNMVMQQDKAINAPI